MNQAFCCGDKHMLWLFECSGQRSLGVGILIKKLFWEQKALELISLLLLLYSGMDWIAEQVQVLFTKWLQEHIPNIISDVTHHVCDAMTYPMAYSYFKMTLLVTYI